MVVIMLDNSLVPYSFNYTDIPLCNKKIVNLYLTKNRFFSVSEYKLFEGDNKPPNPHLSTIIYSLINQWDVQKGT